VQHSKKDKTGLMDFSDANKELTRREVTDIDITATAITEQNLEGKFITVMR
jgi:hypothetical protein